MSFTKWNSGKHLVQGLLWVLDKHCGKRRSIFSLMLTRGWKPYLWHV